MSQQKIAEPPDRVEPKVGQIYTVANNDENYQILYIDKKIVLLRCDTTYRGSSNAHRIERRTSFDQQIESGWFTHQPDSNVDMMTFDEVDWSEVSYIGEQTKENLHDAGYKTSFDVHQADDDELLAVEGLGDSGLSNLKEFSK